jgi:hypothetical protein
VDGLTVGPAARLNLRRVLAVSAASRGRTNEQRMAAGNSLPQALAALPRITTPCAACAWPMWGDAEPPPRPARYCGEASMPGRSWCRAHFARVFNKGE